jgi:PadR family transcriptional regulator, regulatory protein AphA
MTNLKETSEAGATLTEAEYAVLGLLSLGEASGYDLSKEAEHNVDLILAPTKSRIYAVLPPLLERRFVSERIVLQERRPDKRLYRLTKKGRAALGAWLNETDGPLHRDLLLLKLFFGELADPVALLDQLRRFRGQKEHELELLAGYEQANLDRPGHQGVFRNFTVACGRQLARASIDWADRTITVLEEIAGEEDSGG